MNKTNKILIGSVSALCIVGTLTLVKALFNDGGKMLTDWISAFSNALMAGAAVFAAYSAKKWLKLRTHTVGFDKAEILISLIDNHYRWIDLNRMQLLYISGYFGAVEDGSEIASEDREIHYYELKKLYSDKKEEIRNMYHQFELLERWNLNSKYKELIKSTLNNMDMYFSHMVSCFNVAALCIEYRLVESDGYDQLRGNLTIFMSDATIAFQRFDHDYTKFKNIKFDDLFTLR